MDIFELPFKETEKQIDNILSNITPDELLEELIQCGLEVTTNEEEAIERCKELIKESHSCWIGITNQIAIETILNLIVNQKAEIDGLNFDKEILTDTINKQIEEIKFQKDINNIQKKRNKQTEKSLKGIINKQNREIETLKRDFKIVDHECSRLEQEDIRKDKIINKMVKQIVGLTIFDMKKEEPLILKNEIEVIEYFENKVKESK